MVGAYQGSEGFGWGLLSQTWHNLILFPLRLYPSMGHWSFRWELHSQFFSFLLLTSQGFGVLGLGLASQIWQSCHFYLFLAFLTSNLQCGLELMTHACQRFEGLGLGCVHWDMVGLPSLTLSFLPFVLGSLMPDMLPTGLDPQYISTIHVIVNVHCHIKIQNFKIVPWLLFGCIKEDLSFSIGVYLL